MVRLDAYTYACSIYEELRLLFIELGLTVDITNYVNTSRTTYENAINNLTPTNISKGVLLYPLGDYNYKATQINAIFINYLNALDISKQTVRYNINGVQQNLYFQFNILAKNYKDAEYLANLIHGKFYRHSGHRVYDLGTNQFSNEYLYSVSDFGVEANKIGKADLEHIVEYIIAIGLHQVPILFGHTEEEIEYGIFQKLNTVLKINSTNYLVKTEYNYAIGTVVPCNAQSLTQVFQKIPVGVSILIEDAPIVWLQLSLYNTYKANTFILAGTVGTCAYAGDKDDYATVTTFGLENKALTTNFTAKLLDRFTNLLTIFLANNSITTFAKASLPKLTGLHLGNNPLTQIDLSGYPKLTVLDISNTQIQVLEAYMCPLLNSVNITNTPLKTLDLSGTKITSVLGVATLEVVRLEGCTLLTSVDITSDNVNDLNLAGSLNITSLSLAYNHLTRLDLANYTALTTVTANNNELFYANFSHCINITFIAINANLLTTVNLTNCVKLSTLNLTNNRLININLVGLTNLFILNINDNLLTSLDLAGCTLLNTLNVANNLLTSINLNDCGSLTNIRLTNNKLTTLDISRCPLLSTIRIRTNLMNATVLGNLIIDRDSTGLTNGYFQAIIPAGGGTLSAAAIAAKNSLILKGWIFSNI